MNKKLTILHTESSCGWGGQEIRILTEMAGMNARGHHTILICPAESNIFREGKKTWTGNPCTANHQKTPARRTGAA